MAIPKIIAATKSLTKPADPKPKPAGTAADQQARMQQRRTVADHTLDEARLCTATDWPTRKTALLDRFRTTIEHTGKAHDPQLVNRALTNIGQLLEEARALDEVAYHQAKPKLIERWLMWGRKNPEKTNRPVIEGPPSSTPPLAEP